MKEVGIETGTPGKQAVEETRLPFYVERGKCEPVGRQPRLIPVPHRSRGLRGKVQSVQREKHKTSWWTNVSHS